MISTPRMAKLLLQDARFARLYGIFSLPRAQRIQIPTLEVPSSKNLTFGEILYNLKESLRINSVSFLD